MQVSAMQLIVPYDSGYIKVLSRNCIRSYQRWRLTPQPQTDSQSNRMVF